ncbi:MAG: DUF2851 family protein [Chitinophagaceae bacterium]|nr:DUF2851 family protein [Chitinophagaceae bacterium]
MTEKLLQYIWQMQYFNKTDLHTVDQEPLTILHPGFLNKHQGPDFTEANIKIGNTRWAGNVELHVKSSDWKAHHHDNDRNYKNVILHVVWKNDFSVKDSNGVELPVLVLEDRVPKLLLTRYEELMYSQSYIPCEKSVAAVPGLIWMSWKERIIAERLERKAITIKKYLDETSFHWEEVFWWMLARNFGITVNSNVFEEIARSVPVTILAKHKLQIHQLEAFLFGQAGLLQQRFRESYPLMLQKEFRFYKKKYGFKRVSQPVHFLRMRPQSFPTIRLAQLAVLIHRSSHLFSEVKQATDLQEIRKLLGVTANDYWHYHYRFDEETAFAEKTLGHQMINNILINTIVPVVYAYGHLNSEEAFKNKAVNWLNDIPAEENAITRQWKLLGITSQSAFDSQAINELAKRYCCNKRCLSCAVGNAVLKRR